MWVDYQENIESCEKTEPKKLTLIGTSRWIFGILFFIAYFGSLIERNYLGSIFLFLSVLILIPPISQTIEQKFNFTMSGALRFAIVICFLSGFALTIPQDTPIEKLGANENDIPPSDIIASWSGSSTKNTETFHVPPGEWKITWDTQPGQYGDMNFQIFVYNSDGSLEGVAANVIGANRDYTMMRGAGDYYLMINTAQPYTVKVYA